MLFRSCLAASSVFVLSFVPIQAQQSDPLAEILIKKGILKQEDVQKGPIDRDSLIKILQTKGILSAAEAETVRAQDQAGFATKSELMAVKDEVQAVVRETPAGGSSMPKWLDGLYINGDIRTRYEGFDFDGSDLGQADKKQRNRGRVRLRLGLGKEWDNGVGVHVRLATGSTTNPTTTNQTFEGAANKNFNLDRAYMTYSPEKWEWLTLTAGRMPNPFVNTMLVWDGDLNFDGIAEKVSYQAFEHIELFWTAGQFVFEEESDGNDSLLWAWQGGGNVKCTDTFSTTLAVAYYVYQNIDNSAALNTIASRNGNSGSALDLDFEYRIVDILNKYDWELMDKPFSFYWNVAFNTADDNGAQVLEEDFAWGVGAKLGKAKNQGDWECGLVYERIEADAVYAAFDDSDFAGTNRKGFQISGGYKLLDNLLLSGTVYVTENINNSLNTSEQDFTRWQINAIVKF
ncbi:MAG: putative porin [Planctomycetota bacterium]|nr:putative porin [Planctomycetota bacterium]MDA1143024.1 putative porin [Planctomycetota bacterium]